MRLEKSLPSHIPEQIALYQTEHLLTQAVCRFDPVRAASYLRAHRNVMALDIGGDKLRCATYAIGDGKLTKLEERVLRSTKGTGYLPFLERLAAEAVAKDLPVGISSATKLAGSIIQRTVNLPVFFEEFRERYGADYENLFPGQSFVCNDTIAGICGSSTILVLQGHAVRDVAFFICASGMGASVLKDHTSIHVEAGHVQVVAPQPPRPDEAMRRRGEGLRLRGARDRGASRNRRPLSPADRRGKGRDHSGEDVRGG